MPPDRQQLCFLLALPCTDRPPCCGTFGFEVSPEWREDNGKKESHDEDSREKEHEGKDCEAQVRYLSNKKDALESASFLVP